MRISRVTLICGLLAIVGIGLCLVVVPRISAAEVAATPQVVWFSGDQSKGLLQDSSGDLIASGNKIAVGQPVGKLFAAAYYPKDKVLVTVDEGAVTHLYETIAGSFRLEETRPPSRAREQGSFVSKPIHPEVVRFTPVPGLVYITWSYPPIELPVQVGTQFSERKALGLGAYDWHAATTENRDVRFLDYTYQTTSAKSLSLYMPNGKKIDVRLREELASWMGSEPSWLGLEPVFVIPERAIICKTKDGWAMFNPKGKPIKYFPSAHLKNGAWHEPVYHKGQFYVCQSSQGAWCYRMDVASGKLVYVGSRVPQ